MKYIQRLLIILIAFSPIYNLENWEGDTAGHIFYRNTGGIEFHMKDNDKMYTSLFTIEGEDFNYLFENKSISVDNIVIK